MTNQPIFDVVGYQKKIDGICGKTQGKSNVILSWIPSFENYIKYYSDWDAGGFGIKTEMRSQYEEPPPNRWCLKQFQHGSQYALTDDQTRWHRKSEGQQMFYREARPAHPVEGRYIPLITIGRHNKTCCREAKSQGQVCWGDYREPDESYLIMLKRAVADRAERDGDWRCDEPLSAETLKRAALETVQELNEKKQRKREVREDYIDRNLPEVLAHYTGDKSFLEIKEYSVPR